MLAGARATGAKGFVQSCAFAGSLPPQLKTRGCKVWISRPLLGVVVQVLLRSPLLLLWGCSLKCREHWCLEGCVRVVRWLVVVCVKWGMLFLRPLKVLSKVGEWSLGLVFLCIYARECQSVFPWMKPTCWEVDTCCVSILDIFCVFWPMLQPFCILMSSSMVCLAAVIFVDTAPVLDCRTYWAKKILWKDKV